jgi:hypothetical protein
MKSNVGTIDKMIRIITAVAILVLFALNLISGLVAIVLLAFAAIFFVTSFIGICPIYSLLGIGTCERK